eukprot:2398290-Amphidinium_carterae.1
MNTSDLVGTSQEAIIGQRACHTALPLLSEGDVLVPKPDEAESAVVSQDDERDDPEEREEQEEDEEEGKATPVVMKKPAASKVKRDDDEMIVREEKKDVVEEKEDEGKVLLKKPSSAVLTRDRSKANKFVMILQSLPPDFVEWYHSQPRSVQTGVVDTTIDGEGGRLEYSDSVALNLRHKYTTRACLLVRLHARLHVPHCRPTGWRRGATPGRHLSRLDDVPQKKKGCSSVEQEQWLGPCSSQQSPMWTSKPLLISRPCTQL